MVTMFEAMENDVDCAVWLLQKLGATGWQNVAVAALAALIVMAHVPENEQISQLMKRFPPEATGVSVTFDPVVKLAVQVPGQVIPDGLLVTVPVPTTVTVSVEV
jgi:hypothetical protein